jgi:hypothetical protein
MYNVAWEFALFLVCVAFCCVESNFTLHSCIGGLDDLSCEFSSLCYSKTQGFIYYVAGTDTRMNFGFRLSEDNQVFGIKQTKTFLSLQTVSRIDLDKRLKPLEFTFISQPIPRNATFVDETVVMQRRFAASNFGHLLVEATIPAFYLLRAFSVLTRNDVRFLFLDSCLDPDDTSVSSPSTSLAREQCVNNTATLYHLLSDLPTMDVREIPNLTCFRHSLIGSGGKSIAFSRLSGEARGLLASDFRRHVFVRNGLPSHSLVSSRKRIVILRKVGGERLRAPSKASYLHLRTYLLRRFPDWTTTIVDVTSAFRRKLSIYARSSILITPSGSTSFDQIFFGHKTAVIQIPFCSQERRTDCPSWCAPPIGACNLTADLMTCCYSFEELELMSWIPGHHFMSYEAHVDADEVRGSEIILNVTRIGERVLEAVRYLTIA